MHGTVDTIGTPSYHHKKEEVRVKGDRLFDIVQVPYRILFRVHALRQMFQRGILDIDVEEVICNGTIIEEYLDDSPYPSFLIPGIIKGRPLHIVSPYNKEEGVVIVITAYEPDPDLWDMEFTRRKQRELRDL